MAQFIFILVEISRELIVAEDEKRGGRRPEHDQRCIVYSDLQIVYYRLKRIETVSNTFC